MTDGAKKILVAEDDVFMRDIMAKKLGRAGFTVLEAADGEECMKLIETDHPDLLLLDIIMPKMDGFAVLLQIKQSGKYKNIPIIVFSNLGQRDEIEKALKLGARDYIVKANHTPKEIVEKIKKYL